MFKPTDSFYNPEGRSFTEIAIRIIQGFNATKGYCFFQSLMADCLGQASHIRDMNTVHDQEVMGSNPCQVELGVPSTSAQVILQQKNNIYPG